MGGKSDLKSPLAEKQPHVSMAAAAPSDDAGIIAASNAPNRSPWISAVLKSMDKQSKPLAFATGAGGSNAPTTGTGGTTAPQCSALANVGTKSPPVGAPVHAGRVGPSRHVSVMENIFREYSFHTHTN